MKAEEIVKIANEVNFNQHLMDENTALKLEKNNLEMENEKLTNKYNDLLNFTKNLIKTEGFKVSRPTMTNPRRNKIASTQGWKCSDCHGMLGASFDIDHKIRWIDSFDDSDENLRALCVDCHRIKTSMENSKNTHV